MSDEAGAVTRFERVVLPHLDAAYTLARYLVRDPADAQDGVQEAILRALQYFHTLRDERDARAWLLTIVRRECYALGRSRRAPVESVRYDEVPSTALADPAPSPDEVAQRTLQKERVLAAIDQLPEPLREALILRELQQCSYDEIATITDVPVGTVMSRLSRARGRLATTLQNVIDLGEAS